MFVLSRVSYSSTHEKVPRPRACGGLSHILTDTNTTRRITHATVQVAAEILRTLARGRHHPRPRSTPRTLGLVIDVIRAKLGRIIVIMQTIPMEMYS